MKKLMLVAVIVSLSGCASTPVNTIADSCAKADWQGMGLSDGLAGEPPETAASRTKQCAALGTKQNIDLYTVGYVDGIKQYCTYKGGKKAGEKNKPYKPGTCPIELSEEFIRGYQEGHYQWDADRAMKQAKSGNRGL